MDESRRKRVVAISVVVGFLAAFPLMAAAAFVYLRYGDPPVATADKPFPYKDHRPHSPRRPYRPSACNGSPQSAF